MLMGREGMGVWGKGRNSPPPPRSFGRASSCSTRCPATPRTYRLTSRCWSERSDAFRQFGWTMWSAHGSPDGAMSR